MHAIRNPIEVGFDAMRKTGEDLMAVGDALSGDRAEKESGIPEVRSVTFADIRDALSKGMEDFAACRSDVVFICLMYPMIGILAAYAAFEYTLLPLIFPAASGFALLGPVAAIGLYDLSRQRERGHQPSWSGAFSLMTSPTFGAMLTLALVLATLFMTWLGVAHVLYTVTLGPEAPVSMAAFATDVFTTSAGWTMIVAGMGIGFGFALLVFMISVVAFPMLLDRNVGLGIAIGTSLRVVARNPKPMAAWAAIIAITLALGSLPAFLGLIIVLPVLGHTTWHIYRKTVEE